MHQTLLIWLSYLEMNPLDSIYSSKQTADIYCCQDSNDCVSDAQFVIKSPALSSGMFPHYRTLVIHSWFLRAVEGVLKWWFSLRPPPCFFIFIVCYNEKLIKFIKTSSIRIIYYIIHNKLLKCQRCSDLGAQPLAKAISCNAGSHIRCSCTLYLTVKQQKHGYQPQREISITGYQSIHMDSLHWLFCGLHDITIW